MNGISQWLCQDWGCGPDILAMDVVWIQPRPILECCSNSWELTASGAILRGSAPLLRSSRLLKYHSNPCSLFSGKRFVRYSRFPIYWRIWSGAYVLKTHEGTRCGVREGAIGYAPLAVSQLHGRLGSSLRIPPQVLRTSLPGRALFWHLFRLVSIRSRSILSLSMEIRQFLTARGSSARSLRVFSLSLTQSFTPGFPEEEGALWCGYEEKAGGTLF